MSARRHSQRGFAAIAAVFLVVVLAAFGAFMLTFSNTAQVASAQDLQGSRAYWAARAGLEWALVAVPATPALCPNATATPVSGGSVPASVQGFTLQINCAKRLYAEGSATTTLYQFEAIATAGASASDVSRIERSVSTALEVPN
jgi:MSHA biogenesis protein MshP